MTVVAAGRSGPTPSERPRPQTRSDYRPAAAPQGSANLRWLFDRWSTVLAAAERALAAIDRAGLLPRTEIHRRRQSLLEERRWLGHVAGRG
jgi:hypothetical protein